MSRTKGAILLLVVVIALAAAAVVAIPARSQPDQFIIQNADGSNTFALVSSSGLGALISSVPPRFVLANANDNVFQALEPAPAALLALLGQVPGRFVLRHANANRFFPLNYPLELINDATPPQVSQVAAGAVSGNRIRITWTSNEFTTSLVEYGTQSGVYAGSISDNQYRVQHEITISGISSGVTYYYRITNTDRSGNSTQSAEHSFVAIKPLFLPMVVR